MNNFLIYTYIKLIKEFPEAEKLFYDSVSLIDKFEIMGNFKPVRNHEVYSFFQYIPGTDTTPVYYVYKRNHGVYSCFEYLPGTDTTPVQYVYKQVNACETELYRYKQWIDDLQSELYVNCVYCGHRYGRGEITSVSMGDVFHKHIEQCTQHPMFALKKEVELLKNENEQLKRTLYWK